MLVKSHLANSPLFSSTGSALAPTKVIFSSTFSIVKPFLRRSSLIRSKITRRFSCTAKFSIRKFPRFLIRSSMVLKRWSLPFTTTSTVFNSRWNSNCLPPSLPAESPGGVLTSEGVVGSKTGEHENTVPDSAETDSIPPSCCTKDTDNAGNTSILTSTCPEARGSPLSIVIFLVVSSPAVLVTSVISSTTSASGVALGTAVGSTEGMAVGSTETEGTAVASTDGVADAVATAVGSGETPCSSFSSFSFFAIFSVKSETIVSTGTIPCESVFTLTETPVLSSVAVITVPVTGTLLPTSTTLTEASEVTTCAGASEATAIKPPPVDGPPGAAPLPAGLEGGVLFVTVTPPEETVVSVPAVAVIELMEGKST